MSRRLKVSAGDRYGRLTAVSELPKSGNKRMFLFKCDCGVTVNIRLDCVTSGNTKSCGCLKSDTARELLTTHGESGSRLHQCWGNMIQRSRSRKGCSVCEEWKSFIGFRSWSLSNGYRDDLILCRNKDNGDYCPGNVRWDTKRNNNIEANSLTWEVTTPEGIIERVDNMNEYCRINSLSSGTISEVANGNRNHHKGYTNVRRIE